MYHDVLLIVTVSVFGANLEDSRDYLREMKDTNVKVFGFKFMIKIRRSSLVIKTVAYYVLKTLPMTPLSRLINLRKF